MAGEAAHNRPRRAAGPVVAAFFALFAVVAVLPSASGRAANATRPLDAANATAADYARQTVQALNEGRYELVLTLADRALDAAPANATLYVTRGRARRAMGDVSQALVDYTWALHIAPDDAQASLYRGIALREAGRLRGALADLDRAERLLRRAVASAPDANTVASDGAAMARLHLERGMVWGAGGDHAMAEDDFSQAITLFSRQESGADLPMALLMRGLAREARGHFKGALADLDAAVQQAPDFAGAHAARARLLLHLGRDREALDSLDRTLALEPGRVDGLRMRAAARLRTGNADGAQEDAAWALALGPDDASLHLVRARALAQLRRWDGAVAEYTDLLSRAPGLPESRAELLAARAEALREQGDAAGAVRDLGDALTLSDRPQTRCALGVLLLAQGEPGRALEAMGNATGCAYPQARALAAMNRTAEGVTRLKELLRNPALDSESPCAARVTLARFLRRTDSAAAVEILEELTADSQVCAEADAARRADVLLELGLCRLALYRDAAADKAFHRAMEFAATRAARVAGGATQGRTVNGLEALERAFADGSLSVDPDGFPRVDVRVLLGRELLEAGRSEDAVLVLRTAVRGAPEYARAWALLGRARINTGALDAAMESLNHALGVHPELPLALAQRARAARLAGNLEQALADYDALVELLPGSADTLALRGRTLLELGRPDPARRSLERAVAQEPGHELAVKLLRRMDADGGEPAGEAQDD